MAKEFYDISYKTYFNTRIKDVVFQGEETWPLYVQVTYDRETIFFKSYYFDLFSQPKYDFLKMPMIQVDALERRGPEFFFTPSAGRLARRKLPQTHTMCSPT